jgi:hypothetical protein
MNDVPADNAGTKRATGGIDSDARAQSFEAAASHLKEDPRRG